MAAELRRQACCRPLQVSHSLLYTSLSRTYLTHTFSSLSLSLSSGGCGRTGTYIAVSILIERLKTEGVVDVFHTVRNLRLQRPGMVQTEVRKTSG